MRLVRALFNLVQNSMEHTPSGTAVRLSCGHKPDGSAFLAVEDDGGGMDEDRLRRCLDKHYSGNGMRPGKGLGLFIVKSIADAHEAELTIESGNGCGTSLRLVFPKNSSRIFLQDHWRKTWFSANSRRLWRRKIPSDFEVFILQINTTQTPKA